MSRPVALREVVDGLEQVSDSDIVYINRKTGEIVPVSHEDAELVESDEPLEDLHEWQQEILTDVRRVLESDDFIPLPSQFEIHEWSIMERFAQSLDNADHSEDLLDAIHGSGAFGRFKRMVERRGLRDEWFKFRNDALVEIAIEFLVENGILYTRD